MATLRAYGTEAQKNRYFPRVLGGEEPAIAISEPEARSAAADMTTRVEVGPREPMLGLRGIPEGQLHFDGCEARLCQ